MYVIVVGVVLTLLVILCLQVDDWSRDWTTNFAETDPKATEVNLRPIDAAMPTGELADKVVECMRDAERWTIDTPRTTEEGSMVIDMVHKTFLIGFKDDVQVTIMPTRDGCRLHATSQSRVGKGDLGQNPRNIKDLISRLRVFLEMAEPGS